MSSKYLAAVTYKNIPIYAMGETGQEALDNLEAICTGWDYDFCDSEVEFFKVVPTLGHVLRKYVFILE